MNKFMFIGAIVGIAIILFLANTESGTNSTPADTMAETTPALKTTTAPVTHTPTEVSTPTASPTTETQATESIETTEAITTPTKEVETPVKQIVSEAPSRPIQAPEETAQAPTPVEKPIQQATNGVAELINNTRNDIPAPTGSIVADLADVITADPVEATTETTTEAATEAAMTAHNVVIAVNEKAASPYGGITINLAWNTASLQPVNSGQVCRDVSGASIAQQTPVSNGRMKQAFLYVSGQDGPFRLALCRFNRAAGSTDQVTLNGYELIDVNGSPLPSGAGVISLQQ